MVRRPNHIPNNYGGSPTAGSGSGASTVDGNQNTTITNIQSDLVDIETVIDGLGYFATGTDAVNLTGTVPLSCISEITNSQMASTFYEESTFTPSLRFSFGDIPTDITYADNVASYTRIGNRILFQIEMSLTSKGITTGTANITELPYNSNSATNGYCPVNLWIADTENTVSGALTCYIPPGGNIIILDQLLSGVNTPITSSDIKNTTEFMLSGHYRI